VAFDLTGLPPQWDDVQRFMHDESNAWYGNLVDFYLSSPHYGERWARYWLDVTGYADSEGKRSADPIRPHAWRYRDYVIRSFNADKPYNQFLIEQIAGDELYDFEHAEVVTPEMMEALVATGFLRMAPDGTGSDIVNTVDERFEVVADEIEVLGSAVLGLTLKCAQCHSHKYDPIPQRDYYRLVAVFRGAYDVYDWLKPTSVAGQSKQKDPTRRYLNYVTDDIRQQWEGLSMEFDAEIDALNQQLAKRKKELGAKSDAYLKLKTQTNKKIKKLEAARPAEPMVRALWDRGEPSPTWIFRRGDFTNPGDLVGPGVPSVLSDGRTPFELKPKRPGSTGSRLAFAHWLTDTEHPLTARVIVNRVWFHHFGRGIVASLENFGRGGVAPTHPELLDWLAVSFMENGWSLKWLHRQIMLSAAYRQSSRLRPETEDRDPDNRWLSRMPLRRLEAEAVRDSLLAISGQLDLTPFGEPGSVTVRADGLVTSERRANGWRRSVYIRQRRSQVPTILETFDLPQMIPNCVARPNSTVATQSLHLLNNGLVRELALAFAKQIQAAIPRDQNAQVQRAFELALSRHPSDDERRAALDTIVELTAAWQKIEQKQAVDTELDEADDTELSESANTEQSESANTAQGESANPVPSESAETKALANLCHVLINSAECLFVD